MYFNFSSTSSILASIVSLGTLETGDFSILVCPDMFPTLNGGLLPSLFFLSLIFPLVLFMTSFVYMTTVTPVLHRDAIKQSKSTTDDVKTLWSTLGVITVNIVSW